MLDYTLLLIIVIISICELVGQSCLKYLSIHDSQYQYYLFGVIAYAMVCYLLLQSYNYKGMGMFLVSIEDKQNTMEKFISKLYRY